MERPAYKQGFEIFSCPPEEFTSELITVLGEKGWVARACPIREEQYFSKREVDCGRYECQGYVFKEKFSRKKDFQSVESLTEKLKFFPNADYEIRKGRPINEVRGNTFFVVAGVQGLEGTLLHGEKIPDTPFFIAQPCIRTTEDELVNLGGYSNSFVNICTEHVNASFVEHLNHLDNWLSFLSRLGFYAGDMTLYARNRRQDWGTGEFDCLIIEVNYGGLQLGDAVYWYDIPQSSRKSLVLSDIGFGFERIAWAINKTPSYFDAIGPLLSSINKDFILIDSIRTATLMVMSGVSPGDKDRGIRLTKMVNRASNSPSSSLLPQVKPLVERYYEFWSKFFTPRQTMKSSTKIIEELIGTELNDKIYRKLKKTSVNVRPPSSPVMEDYIRQLISESGPIIIESLKE